MRMISITVFVILLVVIIVGVYLVLYNRHINKKLRECDTGKAMLSPGQIALVSVAAGIVALFLLYGFVQSWQDSHPTEIDILSQGNYNVNFFDAEDAESEWTNVYSPEQNEGYTKRVVRDGNFVFIVFECESSHDGLHPDFLIYARYLGDADVYVMECDGEFLRSDGETFTGIGAGCEASDYYLIVGSSSMSVDFRLTVSAYTEEDWQHYFEDTSIDNEVRDFATESGVVALQLDPYPENT